LAERLNWDDPLGKRVQTFNDTIPARVVGLFRNFHQTGMYNPLESLMLIYRVHNPNVYIRTGAGQSTAALAHIERVWNELFPSNPFEYNYLDEQFNRQFEEDEMRGRIFTFFSILTVLIACLGLFSLAAYTVEQRSKEIGIRKVMGATAGRIVRMLILSYLGLVSVSIVLAMIAGYEFGRRWLERFVYKDALDPEAFIVAAGMALMLTLLTVSFHALKASTTNPARVLKDE
jgi:putative ABC transport system permease protein